uniref:VWFC domain-containing protein n=1 Tax=Glossina brevipalpis TaxID=37001 RepID=A0A1A9WZK1_9MUSC
MAFTSPGGMLSTLLILLTISTQLEAYITHNSGCHHNGTWYADKSLVPTTANCLNCQCNKKTLVCRLKVCPEMPMPPPRGCVVVQKKNTCCPYLSCARLDAFYKIPATRRIIAYLDHYERESIDRAVNENMLQRRSADDTEADLYVCVKNGTVYKSGSAMSSSNLCSYCFCIGGTEKCVKPKCMLPLEGCKPIFVDSTCCPVRYDCSSKSTGKSSQEIRYRKTSNKHYLRMSQRMQRNRGCTVNQQFYAEGQKMKADPDKPCDICFCIRGVRKCAPKKCAPALRNCMPVVPKGQCCPSSYDCGSQRDYRRAYNSRQFNLFSLLFGKDNDGETNSTEFAVQYPHDRRPMKEENFLRKPTGSTEKSFFDTLRDGLEFIDSNNNDMLRDDLDALGLQSTPRSIPLKTTTEAAVTVTQNINAVSFLDLLLGSSEADSGHSNKAKNISQITFTSENPLANKLNVAANDEQLSWFDILLKSDEDEVNKITTSTMNYKFDELDFTTLRDQISDVNKLPEEVTDIISSTTEMFTTVETSTPLSSGVWASTTEEISFTQTNPALLPEVVSATEVLQNNTNTANKLKGDNNDNVGTKPDLKQAKPLGLNISTLKDPKPHLKNITTAKPEKKPDLLAVLLDGLSDILTVEKTVRNTTLPNTKLPALLSASTLPYITLPTPKPLPLFKPIPSEKTHVRINSKIANLTAERVMISTKEITNSTFKPLPPVASKLPIIFKKNLTDHDLQVATIIPPFVTTSKPLIIKTNPTILEADPFGDNTQPTLPPSLPNLKIIPFLPTDAVKGNHNKLANYDYYQPNPLTIARIDYNLYDDANVYPSITEKYPIYTDLEDGSKAEYIYKFNVEGPDALVSSTAGKFDGTLGSKAFVKYDFSGSGVQSSKGFSPPTKTESGFVPKEPLLLDDDDEVIGSSAVAGVKIIDNYHITPHIIEITTPANILNTTKVIEITTPDLFKDVIKTKPPPDLTSLIEDKLNSLLTNSKLSPLLPPQSTSSVTSSKPTEMHLIPSVIEVNLTDREINQETNQFSAESTKKYHVTANTREILRNGGESTIANLSQQSNNTDISHLVKHTQSLNRVSEIPTFILEPQANVQSLAYEKNTTTTVTTTAKSQMFQTTTVRAKTKKKQTTNSMLTTVTNTGTTAALVTKRPTVKFHRNKTVATAPTRTKTSHHHKPTKAKNSTVTAMASAATTASMKPKLNATRRGQTSSKPTSTNVSKKPTTSPITVITPTATGVDFDLHSVMNIRQRTTNKIKTADNTKKKTALSSSLVIPTTTNLASTPKTVTSTANPFLMSPFDKLPFMDASIEVKRTSTSLSSHRPSYVNTSNALTDLAHYKHTLNQLEGLEPLYVSPTTSTTTTTTTTTTRNPQYHHSSSSNLIDPIGILKLAGCNIYGRMYRVGRIILELSNPCLECRCTEIGVKCGPLEC